MHIFRYIVSLFYYLKAIKYNIMTLIEIKQAIEEGKKVYWKNGLYQVIKDKYDQYLIKCTSNNSCIGLTRGDEVTMNGDESEFFIQS